MSKHTKRPFVVTVITVGSKRYQSMPCNPPHLLGDCDGCVAYNYKTGEVRDIALCQQLPCTPTTNAQGEHVIYKERV